MRKFTSRSKIFFNASVILAGIYSPRGASGQLLEFAKLGKISGVISILIFHEVVRNAQKIARQKMEVDHLVKSYFTNICPPPIIKDVRRYQSVVIDAGDAHVLASAEESKSDILVSLDKKHILQLRNKVKHFKILSPGELLMSLSVSR